MLCCKYTTGTTKLICEPSVSKCTVGICRSLLIIVSGTVFIGLVGRDSSVGTATRHGLDGPRIESRWGARFSAPVQTGPGAYPTSYAMGTGSFARVKRSGLKKE